MQKLKIKISYNIFKLDKKEITIIDNKNWAKRKINAKKTKIKKKLIIEKKNFWKKKYKYTKLNIINKNK